MPVAAEEGINVEKVWFQELSENFFYKTVTFLRKSGYAVIIIPDVEVTGMISANQFFSNLPAVQCTKCGTVVEEMADCYMIECDDCQDEAYYSLHPRMEHIKLSNE